MKIQVHQIGILFLIFLVSCAAAAQPPMSQTTPVDNGTQKSDKELVEALTPEDPRRQKVMTLTWRIQYQREKLKFLEMKYLAACYKDKEYRDASTMIENLNKQIRQLILL